MVTRGQSVKTLSYGPINALACIAALFFFTIVSAQGLAGEPLCSFKPLSPRVYLINGSDASACPEKSLQHPVTNPVAILGDQGVVLIDPGSSEQVGQLVVNRLRLITSKPVIAIINTHIHGLYWLANHAVKQAYPEAHIYAQQKMIERIENGEGQFWVDAITGQFDGDKTLISAPDRAIKGDAILNLNGVELKVYQPGHAHTDHDLLIEVVQDKIMILGGLVVEPEVPSEGVPQDAIYKGQIEAMAFAIQRNMLIYVPGQGYPQGIELPKRGLKFLQAIYTGVERYYADDLADFEITEQLKLDLVEFKQWYRLGNLGGVVAQMYLQIEQQKFGN